MCVVDSGGATPGPAGARAPAGNAVPRLVPRLEKIRYFKFLKLWVGYHFEFTIHCPTERQRESRMVQLHIVAVPLLLQDATSRKVSQAAVAGLRLKAVTVTSQALLSPYHTFTEFEKERQKAVWVDDSDSRANALWCSIPAIPNLLRRATPIFFHEERRPHFSKYKKYATHTKLE